MNSNEALARLMFPFRADEHDWHPYFGFVYLREEAINRRLNEVFGVCGWSKVVTNVEWIPEGVPVVKLGKRQSVLLDQYPGQVVAEGGNYYELIGEERRLLDVVFDIPACMTYGYIEATLDGQTARRYTVGGDVLTDLGKERGAQTMNTRKASDTDLLKRGARQFGVGLYLTEVPKGTTEQDFPKWLKQHCGPTTLQEAKAQIVASLTNAYGDVPTIAAAIKKAGYTQDFMLYHWREVIDELSASAPKAA